MKLLQLLLQMSQQTTDAESDICGDGAIRSFATHVFLPRITVSPFSASPRSPTPLPRPFSPSRVSDKLRKLLLGSVWSRNIEQLNLNQDEGVLDMCWGPGRCAIAKDSNPAEYRDPLASDSICATAQPRSNYRNIGTRRLRNARPKEN